MPAPATPTPVPAPATTAHPKPATKSPAKASPAPSSKTPATTTSIGPGDHVQKSIRAGNTVIRGVNLGGWLVAERWMTEGQPCWKNVSDDISYLGEYFTMKSLTHTPGDDQFKQHRDTWITEQDIQAIASIGLNLVRVPVGFWIMGDQSPDQSPDAPWRTFAPGSIDYLDRLINDWAVKYNLAVMLSLHGHIWSQNGYDHSAPLIAREQHWTDDDKYDDNKEYSIQWAAFMAERYRTSVAFLGLNLMNEPLTPAKEDLILDYFQEAYGRIRSTNDNDCILVVSPQVGAQSPGNMQDFMLAPNYTNVWHEWHPYFIWGHENSNAKQIIDAANGSWHGNPLFFGEWCLNASSSAVFTKDTMQQYVDAQLSSFKTAQKGYTFWSWRHSDYAHGKRTGWSLMDILNEKDPNYQVKFDFSQ
ncbi:TPA: hypothetical protein N0F65_006106 [Lagenidium giganteum]|uniref:glucan 1,3-beta-glucosidase n=1 Tax=Lagenidium giganteum TaxID=4803 RepID=A0AAV2Z3D6_9STRA|nr:TPA: hypothetical protein N0F65_006106 [Lagenidium giganteum]